MNILKQNSRFYKKKTENRYFVCLDLLFIWKRTLQTAMKTYKTTRKSRTGMFSNTVLNWYTEAAGRWNFCNKVKSHCGEAGSVNIYLRRGCSDLTEWAVKHFYIFLCTSNNVYLEWLQCHVYQRIEVITQVESLVY